MPDAQAQTTGEVEPFESDTVSPGAFPLDDPLSVSDREAIESLRRLAPSAPVTDALRRFVRVIFACRKRQLWVAASRALAQLALRDQPLHDFIEQMWNRCFPAGLPATWGTSLRSAHQLAGGEWLGVHELRHQLHLACVWIAQGQRLDGLDPAKLLSMGLPTEDVSDGSVVLLALGELARGHATRDQVLPALPHFIAQSPPDEMHESTLRDLGDDLRSAPAAAELVRAIDDLLARPRWKDRHNADRLDAALSWLKTAQWFHARGEQPRVDEMRSSAAELATTIRIGLDGELPAGCGDAVDAILARLANVLDPDVLATTPDTAWVPRVLELLVLFERAEVRDLPWRSLAARALPLTLDPPPTPGTVRQAARADLAMRLAFLGQASGVLLREMELEAAPTLHLANCNDGLVARQVAIQSERLLRGMKDAQSQVKFLWQLLQRDPHEDFFKQLSMVLRTDPDRTSPLKRVVDAIANLDRHHREQGGAPQIASDYRQLADAAAELLGAPAPPTLTDSSVGAPAAKNPIPSSSESLAIDPDPRVMIRHLSEQFASIAPLLKSGLTTETAQDWTTALKRLLIGGRGTGLDDWMKWLGEDVRELDTACTRFEYALLSVAQAVPTPLSEPCNEMDEALEQLSAKLAPLAWPESRVVQELFRQARRWLAERRVEAKRSREASAQLQRVLSHDDEEALLRIASDSEHLRALPVQDLKRIGSFLLKRGLLISAHRFRKRVSDRVHIPAAWSYLGPSLAGVAAGPLLVGGSGDAWNESLLHGMTWSAGMTGVLVLLLSFGMLAAHVSQNMGRNNQGRWRRRRILGRAALMLLFTWTMALLVSAATMWTLQDTSFRRPASGEAPAPFLLHLILFTGIAQFFGLFLGLIAQGRGLANDET